MNMIPLIEAVARDELILVDGGMCHFHRRRDGVITIRELLVLPAYRKNRLGRWLVERVQRDYPQATLRARCPCDWPANDFWQAVGFVLVTAGKVNVWERASSTAPLATLLSVGLL